MPTSPSSTEEPSATDNTFPGIRHTMYAALMAPKISKHCYARVGFHSHTPTLLILAAGKDTETYNLLVIAKAVCVFGESHRMERRCFAAASDRLVSDRGSYLGTSAASS